MEAFTFSVYQEMVFHIKKLIKFVALNRLRIWIGVLMDAICRLLLLILIYYSVSLLPGFGSVTIVIYVAGPLIII